MADVEVRATYQQHLDFNSSFVWQDFSGELTVWIEQAHSELEVERNPVQIYHLQGVIEALRRVLQLPQEMLQILENIAALEESEDE